MSGNAFWLIVSCISLYLALGLIAGGWAFAFAQKRYPEIAAYDYYNDVATFWVVIVFGPAAFVPMSFFLLFRRFRRRTYYGMFFPGQWTLEDARELERNARQTQALATGRA